MSVNYLKNPENKICRTWNFAENKHTASNKIDIGTGPTSILSKNSSRQKFRIISWIFDGADWYLCPCPVKNKLKRSAALSETYTWKCSVWKKPVKIRSWNNATTKKRIVFWQKKNKPKRLTRGKPPEKACKTVKTHWLVSVYTWLKLRKLWEGHAKYKNKNSNQSKIHYLY